MSYHGSITRCWIRSDGNSIFINATDSKNAKKRVITGYFRFLYGDNSNFAFFRILKLLVSAKSLADSQIMYFVTFCLPRNRSRASFDEVKSDENLNQKYKIKNRCTWQRGTKKSRFYTHKAPYLFFCCLGENGK